MQMLLTLAFSGTALAQQVPPSTAEFVGANGCKSSGCHGGAGEKRSQHITWTRHDFHARAYAVLTNARSERIAETLGLPAANTSSRCTSCHSPFLAVPQTRLASEADPREGVSCESCHGAAGSWLRGHTRPDWTYATRVGAGMRDLKSFYVRANTCVACHQNIEPELLDAGHPELLFELDGQSAAQPKHWKDPENSGPRAWLTGQAVALRELSWRLAITPQPDPNALEQWRGLTWLLHQVTSANAGLPGIDAPVPEPDAAMLKRVQSQADALARSAAAQKLGRDFAAHTLRRLARLDEEFKPTPQVPEPVLFRRAQRHALALERLSIGAAPGGEDQPVAGLSTLRDDLRNPAAFDPARYAELLREFARSLGETAP